MKVNEIMTADVVVISPESSIQDAARRLKSLEVGSLPVCNGERLVGMITDRDIAIRAVAEGWDAAGTAVAKCMTPEVRWCYEDEPLEEAGRIMRENQIRRLPIISREKRLVGILSIGDIAIKTDETRKVGETVQAISELAPA
ncbi:MAG: CBS domain-containing protein [Verrucomicrobiota bacterium]